MRTRGNAARRLAAVAPGVPLYLEVKRRIMEAIMAGEWQPGAALPSEAVLADRFEVAMGTLRKAVGELADEHILVRQQGRGTFVATHDQDHLRFHFFHIAPRGGLRELPTVELLAFRRGRATEDEAAALKLERGEAVVRFRNLLSIRGSPVVVDSMTIPHMLFQGLTEEQVRTRPGTVYQLYQSAFGITVVRSAERLRAVTAPEDVAQRLGLAPGAPVLEIRRVALTYEDRPVELRSSLVNTEAHEYVSDLGERS